MNIHGPLVLEVKTVRDVLQRVLVIGELASRARKDIGLLIITHSFPHLPPVRFQPGLQLTAIRTKTSVR